MQAAAVSLSLSFILIIIYSFSYHLKDAKLPKCNSSLTAPLLSKPPQTCFLAFMAPVKGLFFLFATLQATEIHLERRIQIHDKFCLPPQWARLFKGPKKLPVRMAGEDYSNYECCQYFSFSLKFNNIENQKPVNGCAWAPSGRKKTSECKPSQEERRTNAND